MADNAADTLEPPLDPISEDEGYEDLDEREEIIPQHYGISSYGADFPVDGLVKRMENGDIIVPTFDPGVGDEDLESSAFSGISFGPSHRQTVSSSRSCSVSRCPEFSWFKARRTFSLFSMVSSA